MRFYLIRLGQRRGFELIDVDLSILNSLQQFIQEVQAFMNENLILALDQKLPLRTHLIHSYFVHTICINQKKACC